MSSVAALPQIVSERAPMSRTQVWRMLIILFPIVLTIVYIGLLASKVTRPFAVLMTQENYPVELGTFLFAIIAGIQSLYLSRQVKRAGAQKLFIAFYIIFGIGLIWVGLEEIDYGQWFFHWKTPEAISRINTQHEFNMHNLEGMGGHTEYLRLAFGAGGLFGVALSFWAYFRAVSVSRLLFTWFAVITVLAACDLYCDIKALDTNFAKAMDVMSEVVELMISIAASIYLWLKAKELRRDPL
jgi:hypothetical protein